MPLTLFCAMADQQRAAARDVPAGSDSDGGRQMMKLLSVQSQRAMHGGAFLPPPSFRSSDGLSWWMEWMDGGWRVPRLRWPRSSHIF